MSNQNQPYGVDISRYQYSQDGRQKINFDVLNPLIKFCGIRAAISWGYTDPWFSYSWASVTAPRLAYHVLYPGEDAVRQMDHFLRIVNPGEHDRLALDLELDHGYTKYQITQTVLSSLERLRSETGRYPIIYSRAYWVNDHLYVAGLPPNLDWWLATYLTALPAPAYTPERPSPPILPVGVNNWLIHQTGDRANGGAHGVASYYIDTNRWNGTQDDMLSYFGLNESHEVYLPIIVTPEPEPEPALPPGLLDVPVYAQKDPRWAKDRMGASYFTLEQKGCLTTITVAGLAYFGLRLNDQLIGPKEYNRLASTRGGYEIKKEGNTVYANMYWLFPDILTDHQIVRAEYNCIYFNQGWKPKADAILASKRPVWTEVRLNGWQHWVLIIGNVNGVYWCLDPWHGDIVDMSTRYDRVYRIVSYRRN